MTRKHYTDYARRWVLFCHPDSDAINAPDTDIWITVRDEYAGGVPAFIRACHPFPGLTMDEAEAICEHFNGNGPQA